MWCFKSGAVLIRILWPWATRTIDSCHLEKSQTCKPFASVLLLAADEPWGSLASVLSLWVRLHVFIMTRARPQETLLLAIGQLGSVAHGEVLLVLIISLVQALADKSLTLRAIAFQQVRSGGGWIAINLTDMIRCCGCYYR